MQLVIAALLLLGGLLLSRHLKERKNQHAIDAIAKEHGCLPPPLLKNHRPFGIDRLEQIFRAGAEFRIMEHLLLHFRQTGSTFKQVFFRTPAFATIDPANLEAILSTDFADWGFGIRRAVTFPMFGDGILTQEREAWRRSREILRPQLVYRQYEGLKVFHEPMEDLLRCLESSNGVVDLQPLFFRFTLDITTAFLFGESVHSLKCLSNSQEQTFARSFDIAQSWVAKRLRLPTLNWLITGHEFREACRQVHSFADRIIDKNLLDSASEDAETSGRYVFLKAVSKACPDRDSLRGQVINVLVAGRDTTACLLSWTFFTLVRHPKALEKLRDEITALDVKEDELKRCDLRGLRYLQNVLKEILRLYPSVPVNQRSPLKTVVLPTGGGPDGKPPVLIPAGSPVSYSVYALHRRPDLYGMDAELFRPERWDEDMPLFKDRVTKTYGYLPFNGGPRICLGMDFALTEAAYAIVRILQRYPNIALPAGEKVELAGVEKQSLTLVLRIAEGCKVQLA